MKELVKPLPSGAIKETKPFFSRKEGGQTSPFFQGTLQMKKESESQADPFEQEADRVADLVVNHEGSLQGEEPEKAVGKHFGVELGQVNIHTGEGAARMSRELKAKAFTVGRDIYFNDNRYQPESKEGKRLLAHEMTHVAQHVTGKVPKPVIQRTGEQDIAGISTPVPAGLQPNAQGEYHTVINGMNVHIVPDRTSTAEGIGGITRYEPSGGSISNVRFGRDKKVSSFSGPSQITITIRTTYQRDANPASASAYGAGPTLRAHEGSHGTDYLNYLTNTPPPSFDGTIGMTRREFRRKMSEYSTALQQYYDNMGADSVRRTDCTGSTTIDDATGSNVCTP